MKKQETVLGTLDPNTILLYVVSALCEKYLYFTAFRPNTEIYKIYVCIQSKCGNIRTRKTLNRNTFFAVLVDAYAFPKKIDLCYTLLTDAKQIYLKQFCFIATTVKNSTNDLDNKSWIFIELMLCRHLVNIQQRKLSSRTVLKLL